jgi:uncharacterized protein YukE
MSGDIISYPFQTMAQGATDINAAARQVAELQTQFQEAMRALLAAWQSEAASPRMQELQQLWAQSSGEINQLLSRRGTALDDAWISMKQADSHAANGL